MYSKYFSKKPGKLGEKKKCIRNRKSAPDDSQALGNGHFKELLEDYSKSSSFSDNVDCKIENYESLDYHPNQSCATLYGSGISASGDSFRSGFFKGSDENNLELDEHCSTTSRNAEMNFKYDDFIMSTPNKRNTIPLRSYSQNASRRRISTVYKQKVAEKCKGRKSHYFSNRSLEQIKWLPPRSPYCLIQEDLYHNPWQLLIATIFLTKTQAKKAIPQILKFLERWPTPQSLLAARQEDIVEYLRPLGIQHVRSSLIQKFSAEFLEKEWTYPDELHGIGKYGNDSYRIFCVNEWRHVQPDDNKLNLYKNWLIENAERLGL